MLRIRNLYKDVIYFTISSMKTNKFFIGSIIIVIICFLIYISFGYMVNKLGGEYLISERCQNLINACYSALQEN